MAAEFNRLAGRTPMPYYTYVVSKHCRLGSDITFFFESAKNAGMCENQGCLPCEYLQSVSYSQGYFDKKDGWWQRGSNQTKDPRRNEKHRKKKTKWQHKTWTKKRRQKMVLYLWSRVMGGQKTLKGHGLARLHFYPFFLSLSSFLLLRLWRRINPIQFQYFFAFFTLYF